ncbi:MAG TPA: urea amidolyase, partial [Aliiroseovarius sp.]|nr:urea amidolyase [Aliiroseovarius sp.]
GVPYVRLAECQTTGGYARIGSVIPADLPRIAQAPPGAQLHFEMLSWEEADRLWRAESGLIGALASRAEPLTRDPHDIADLLSYQLISGVVAGDEES